MGGLWISMIYLSISILLVLSNDVLAANSLHSERLQDGPSSPHTEKEHKHDHEAILGSRDLVEEFEDLPPEEAKRRLRVIAKLMDADRNGFVNKQELRKWIVSSFDSIAKEQSDEKFEEDDRDKDGKVSWKEHLSETFGDGSFEDHSMNKELTTRLIEEEKEQFEQADTNKDGFLTSDEFIKFINPHQYSEFHPLLVNQTLRSKDKDKDGKISMEEFLIDEDGNEISKEHVLAEKERFEYDLDKNKDGFLDEKEVAYWIIPDNEHIAHLEAEHLMDNSDDNRDGQLSIDEIVEHHDVFVGSEATDYGEHLLKYKDEL